MPFMTERGSMGGQTSSDGRKGGRNYANISRYLGEGEILNEIPVKQNWSEFTNAENCKTLNEYFGIQALHFKHVYQLKCIYWKHWKD